MSMIESLGDGWTGFVQRGEVNNDAGKNGADFDCSDPRDGH